MIQIEIIGWVWLGIIVGMLIGIVLSSLMGASKFGDLHADNLKLKLDQIEDGATADLTGPEIKELYEAQPNAFTDILYTKLSNLDINATADMSDAEIKTAYENYSRRVQTSVLNDVVVDAVYINPPKPHNGDKVKVYYATQVASKPPTFVLFVNDEHVMHFSYERYLKNRLRESFNFEGTPIKVVLRKRD